MNRAGIINSICNKSAPLIGELQKECAMYFGSVKFFKHLILTFIILIILGLSATSMRLAAINKHYEEQLNLLESQTTPVQPDHDPAFQEGSPIEYQKIYPDMHAALASPKNESPNTVYLTFDDGPSKRTPEILEILKNYNIQATFFIIGKEGKAQPNLLKRMSEDGHSIGIHTYSHAYDKIYSSVENYLHDFYLTYELIYEITGKKPSVFRFPGGSINRYSLRNYQEIIAEMIRRGFTYYDWNASSGDAGQGVSAASVYSNTIQSSENKSRVILLMHDSAGKSYTVAALPKIIEYYQSKGFQFAAIHNDVNPVVFNYANY